MATIQPTLRPPLAIHYTDTWYLWRVSFGEAVAVVECIQIIGTNGRSTTKVQATRLSRGCYDEVNERKHWISTTFKLLLLLLWVVLAAAAVNAGCRCVQSQVYGSTTFRIVLIRWENLFQFLFKGVRYSYRIYVEGRRSSLYDLQRTFLNVSHWVVGQRDGSSRSCECLLKQTSYTVRNATEYKYNVFIRKKRTPFNPLH